MSQAKHTPAPWFFDADDKQCQYVRAKTQKDKEVTVAVINGWFPEHRAEELANAHLIKTAPKLLSALKNMLDPTYGDFEGRLQEKEARAAIAEAEGRA